MRQSFSPSKRKKRFRPRPAFDDLQANLTAENALERVKKACGSCPRGRDLYEQFKHTAMCSVVRELLIEEAPVRPPVSELVRVLAQEFLLVMSHVYRDSGRQWVAQGPALYRGHHHRELTDDERHEWQEREADRAAADQGPDPKPKERVHFRKEHLGVSRQASMAARVNRLPRTLHDHFKLLRMGRVLNSYRPPRKAKDAIHTPRGTYARYQLFSDGAYPDELVRRWRIANGEIDDGVVLPSRERPPVDADPMGCFALLEDEHDTS
jgi:hypothetical protein